MPDHRGIGAEQCASVEEVQDFYEQAMADGRIDEAEDRALRWLFALAVRWSSEVALALTVISTVARCAERSRRRRRLLADWRATGVARLFGAEAA